MSREVVFQHDSATSSFGTRSIVIYNYNYIYNI